MYCFKCGAILNQGERSCAACGAKVVPTSEDGTPLMQPSSDSTVRRRNPLLIPLIAVSALLLACVSFFLGGRFSNQLIGTALVSAPVVSHVPTPTPLATPTATVDPADLQIVTFVDKQVEAWIRLKYINKDGPITVADMKQITVFEFDPVNDSQATGMIESLDDLRHCANLRTLSVFKQPVSSISSLSGLENLTSVSIDCCDVADLTPLAGKKNLRIVWISGCPVQDASPVLALPNLREINANGSMLSDISPLADTRGLTAFYFDRKLKDYSPLFCHTAITDLELSGISNDDFIAMLVAMKRLAAFRIDNSAIEESGLKLLNGRNMYALSLNNCGLKDISALSGLAGVSDLRLTDNQIEDISPLAGLTGIDYCLDLRSNSIRDYSPLRNMKSLRSLYVMGNPVTDDETLRELEQNGCKVHR